MKREVGGQGGGERGVRVFVAEADVEAAERRAGGDGGAERGADDGERAASGSSAGLATTERVAALEGARGGGARRNLANKRAIGEARLVETRARIASLRNLHRGRRRRDTVSRISREDARAGSTSRAVSRRARARRIPRRRRPRDVPNTVAESREPSFPAIVANEERAFTPSASTPRRRVGDGGALGSERGAASAPKPPRARSAALARRASHRA